MRTLSLVLVLVSAQAALADEPVKTFRGFPIWPPEAAAGIAPDAMGAELPLRNRAAALEHLKTVSGIDGFEGDAAISAAFAELRQALAYTEKNAPAQGWTLLQKSMLLDGGSQLRRYARSSPSGLDVASVLVRSGMVMTERGEKGASVSSPDHWAKVSYGFEHLAPPELLDGFPLYLAPSGTAAQAVSGDGARKLGYVFTPARSPLRDDVPRFPLAHGWTRHHSPLLKETQSLFVRGPQVVLLEVSGDKAKLTSLTGDPGARLLAQYPEQVSEHAEVSSGLIIRDGRYVRRPYRVELVDGVLRLNGVVLLKFDEDSEADELELFHGEVDGLNKGAISIFNGTGRLTSGRHSEVEIQALLARIDEVVTGPGTREAKLQTMTTDPALKKFFRDVPTATVVLEKWDGVK